MGLFSQSNISSKKFLDCQIMRPESDLDAWLTEVRNAVLAKLPDGPAQLYMLHHNAIMYLL